MKIPKGQPEAATHNTIAKRKRAKEQTMTYKTLHRLLLTEQNEPPLLAETRWYDQNKYDHKTNDTTRF